MRTGKGGDNRPTLLKTPEAQRRCHPEQHKARNCEWAFWERLLQQPWRPCLSSRMDSISSLPLWSPLTSEKHHHHPAYIWFLPRQQFGEEDVTSCELQVGNGVATIQEGMWASELPLEHQWVTEVGIGFLLPVHYVPSELYHRAGFPWAVVAEGGCRFS